MSDIRIREHEQGIRLKEDDIKAFDAADDLWNAAHHAYIKGRESVEKQDDEKPEDQFEQNLREGKDAAEKYIKKALEEDEELMEEEGAASAPSEASEVEYVPLERQREQILTSYQKKMNAAADRLRQRISPAPDVRVVTRTRLNETVTVKHPERQKAVTVSSDPEGGRKSPLYQPKEPDLSLGKSAASKGTNPASYGDKSVPETVHAIKTREASSIKEYHPTVKYADKGIKTSEAAGKTIKAEKAAEARTAGKTGQAAGAAGRTVAKQSANAAGQAAAKGSANAAASSAANSAAATAAEGAVASSWIVWAVIAIIILIITIMANFMGSVLTYRMTENDESIPIREAVTEINQDFQAELDRLRNRRTYDNVILEGTRPRWSDVLAVFFAKTEDDEDGIDTYSFYFISERGKEKLKEIFWDMTDIGSEVNRYSVEELVRMEDEDGNAYYEMQTVRKVDLTITVTGRTAYEMEESLLYLNNDQREDLYDFLSEEYEDLWPRLVYGYIPEDCPIVEIALQEVGNIGGEKYWRWYGFGSHVDWCACFVSWCADECGYISNGKIPKYARCANGVQWFQEQGQWLSADTDPAPGMIIFFDWDHPEGQSGPQDGHADHTGIVERVEDDIIYTAEGNAWDVCMQNQYPVGWYEILGYGTYDMTEEQ